MVGEMDSRFRGKDGKDGKDGKSGDAGSNRGQGGPLQGVRVVEMGQLIAIPFAMKLLADMGGAGHPAGSPRGGWKAIAATRCTVMTWRGVNSGIAGPISTSKKPQ